MMAVGGGQRKLRRSEEKGETARTGAVNLPLFSAVGLLGNFAGHDDDGALTESEPVWGADVLIQVLTERAE
jgi:hypothetical protein